MQYLFQCKMHTVLRRWFVERYVRMHTMLKGSSTIHNFIYTVIHIGISKPRMQLDSHSVNLITSRYPNGIRISDKR